MGKHLLVAHDDLQLILNSVVAITQHNSDSILQMLETQVLMAKFIEEESIAIPDTLQKAFDELEEALEDIKDINERAEKDD